MKELTIVSFYVSGTYVCVCVCVRERERERERERQHGLTYDFKI